MLNIFISLVVMLVLDGSRTKINMLALFITSIHNMVDNVVVP